MRSCYFGKNGIQAASFLVSKLLQTISKLRESNSSGSAFLDLAKDKIDIGSGQLLVNQFSVFGKLGETLTIHRLLSCTTVVSKSLLNLLLRSASGLNHPF